jgi:hypothetical protein
LITDIYKRYNIMPSLQVHMLRVAAVGCLVCDNFDTAVDKNSIITACLIHDIGNIIKFNLNYLPEFLEPEGLEYWEKVKADFVRKYGSDDRRASYKIAQELGMPIQVLRLIDAFSFVKSPEISGSTDWDRKLCFYTDQRVSPFAVEPLEVRIQEGRSRFKANRGIIESNETFEYYARFAREVEMQIFAHCKIKPETINDNTVMPLIKKLGYSTIGE